MHADDTEVNRLSERHFGCAFRVLNTLGAGFLEKVYENALGCELRKTGLLVAQQQGVAVLYQFPVSATLGPAIHVFHCCELRRRGCRACARHDG